MLLSLFPGMAAAGAAAAEAVRHAGTAPAGLRDQLLAMTSGQDPSAVAHRVALGQRAGSFGKSGFPKALSMSKPVLRASRGQVITAAAGTAAVAAATAIAIAVSGGPPPAPLSGGGPPRSPSVVAPQPGGGTRPPRGPTARPSAGASATPPSGAVPGGQAVALAGGLGSSASPAGGNGAAGGPGSSSSAGSSSPATSPSGGGKPPPSSVPPSSTPPSSPPPPHTPPPPAQGTLDVSPTTIVLTPLLGRTITLTASGGPVNWSISKPSSLLGKLHVSPSSGTIEAGHSEQVTVWTSLVSLGSQLTVSPGGQQVTVLVGVGLLR
jgi:hypothetical protein